jgi:hypothetical protein
MRVRTQTGLGAINFVTVVLLSIYIVTSERIEPRQLWRRRVEPAVLAARRLPNDTRSLTTFIYFAANGPPANGITPPQGLMRRY